MSHPHGAYLGGIRTVECLRQRSFVDEETGCWHWRLACCEGFPRVWLKHPTTGKTWRTTGSMAAYVLKHGRAMQTGRKGYRLCQTDDCVNPEHIRAWTRAEHGKWIAEQGTWKNQPHRIAANTKISHATRAKLSLEKAREIRASDETHVELGKRYGVPPSTIGAIKIGKLWREPGMSVFTWREAA